MGLKLGQTVILMSILEFYKSIIRIWKSPDETSFHNGDENLYRNPNGIEILLYSGKENPVGFWSAIFSFEF